MKTPLLYVLLVVLSALFCLYTSFNLAPIVFVLILIFLNISLEKYRQKIVFSIFLFLALLYFLIFDYTFTLESNRDLAGKVVQGYINDVFDYGFTLSNYSIKGSDEKYGKYSILIYSDEEVMIGDKISLSLHKPRNKNYYNKGSFDFNKYLKSKKISGVYSAKLIDKTDSKKYFLRKILYTYRSNLYSLLENNMQKNSRILAAILLGISTKTDLYDIKRAGLIHIFAISGMHLAIISGIFYKLSLAFLYEKRRASGLSIALIILYTILTGLHTSTIRACIMIVLYFFKDIFLREYDRSSALSLAFLLMIIFNPYSMYSAGFALSFSAVIGIFYLSKKLPLGKSKKEILRLVNTIFAVWISISPVLVFYFYSFSTYSVLANFLVLPLLPIILLLGILGLILPAFLSKLVLFAASFLLDFIIDFSSLISILPYSEINVGSISVLVLLLCFIMLFSFKKNKYIFTLSSLTILIFLGFFFFKDKSEIDFLDIGNGDAIIFRDDGKTMLIDGGGIPFKEGNNQGIKVLLPYLKAEGINKIDIVVVSHSDFDHIYGIIELLGKINIEKIAMNDFYADKQGFLLDELRKKADVNKVKIIYLKNEDMLNFGSGNFTFFTPYTREDRITNNSASLMMLGEFYQKKFLFLGDCEKNEENFLLKNYENQIEDIELLKVAHHGSKTSSKKEFLECVEPDLSVICVGRNNRFSHPNEEVVERILDNSKLLLTTANFGEINVFIDGENLRYRTYFNEGFKGTD